LTFVLLEHRIKYNSFQSENQYYNLHNSVCHAGQLNIHFQHIYHGKLQCLQKASMCDLLISNDVLGPIYNLGKETGMGL